MFALDTETTGTHFRHGCRPFIVSGCNDEGTTFLWEWDVDPMTREPNIPARDIKRLNAIHAQEDMVFHNAKFDVRALASIGVKPPDWDRVDDTLIASHVLASGESHKLKDLSLMLLDINDDDQADLKEATNQARRIGRKLGWRIAAPEDPHFPAMKRAPHQGGWGVLDTWLPRAVAKYEGRPKSDWFWTVASKYAILDAERTMGLWMVLEDGMEEEDVRDVYEVRKNLLRVTYRMESGGVSFSQRRLKAAVKKYQERAEHAEDIAIKIADGMIDNVRSPKQLQGTLFGHFKLKPGKETKTGYSTDADTLRALEDSIPRQSKAACFIRSLQASRKFSKAVDYLQTYGASGIPVPGHKDYGILYPSFNITGTATTRFSSHDPNAQNISKQEDFNLREVFGPLPGREWFAADYSNVELRIFAYASGDQRLIDAFKQGLSMHHVVGEALHPKLFNKLGPEEFAKTQQYRWVKNGNFSLIYGAGVRKANATYRVPDAYDRMRKTLPKIDEFIRNKANEARRKGYVETLGGYRLQVDPNQPHKAANYFVQGTAGWAMILALNRVHNYLVDLGDDYRMNMTIHDEIDFDFPRRKTNWSKMKKIKALMEMSGDDLGIPMPVDVDRIRTNWADGKVMKI